MANSSEQKKILVVYYSRDGGTERVAKDIAERLQAESERMIDTKNRKGFLGWFGAARDARRKRETSIEPIRKNPADYDIVIIGTPMWASSMTPAVRTYINQYKGSFKHAAYFVVSAGMSADKVLKSMVELAGTSALASVGVVHADFKKKERYEEKLNTFISALKSSS